MIDTVAFFINKINYRLIISADITYLNGSDIFAIERQTSPFFHPAFTHYYSHFQNLKELI